MIHLSHALALALFGLLCGTLVSKPVAARDTSRRSSNAKRRDAAKRWEEAVHGNDARNARRATDTSAPAGVKNITFSNPKASRECTSAHVLFILFCLMLLSEFYVDGTTLPLVDFDVGPSWAGLIPISGAANETRKVRLLETSTGCFGSTVLISQLFFWFFPPGPTGSLDDFIFW
jgi:carboxypeptidase D